MIRNRRNKKYLYVLILFLALGIGFAALAANLKINGTVNIDSASWDVHFENVQITQGSVTANPAPTSNNVDTTEMTYTVNFTKPGDFYEFTVDIANDGSIDAMINLVSNTTYEQDGTTPKNLPDYLRSSVTYDDGVQIKQNQELLHNTSETIKVRIEYRTDIDTSDLPDTADTVVFKLEEDYKQKDENAKPVRFNADFETDSWDDITTAYDKGLTENLEEAMANGTTREVQLDMDNDGTPETTAHLRIANMSAPSECAQPGFSRSACGLVLEFVESISDYRMNPWTNGNVIGDGNYGGWEHSEMRNYLNSTVYNALPPELKSRVIDTPVVSGYDENKDSANFYTIDKLYLLSTKELWGKEGTSNVINYDTAEAETRQLDYYHDIGVRTDNFGGASKKDLNGVGHWWWLRTTYSYITANFYGVNPNGSMGSHYSSFVVGVSPAFRIG